MVAHNPPAPGLYVFKKPGKEEPTIILTQPKGAKRKVALCGTYSGYDRHQKKNEWADARCLQANADRTALVRGTPSTGKRNNKAKCGTYAGYRKHERDKTRKCWPCSHAYFAYQEKYKYLAQARLIIKRELDLGKIWHPSMKKVSDPVTGAGASEYPLATPEEILKGLGLKTIMPMDQSKKPKEQRQGR